MADPRQDELLAALRAATRSLEDTARLVRAATAALLREETSAAGLPPVPAPRPEPRHAPAPPAPMGEDGIIVSPNGKAICQLDRDGRMCGTEIKDWPAREVNGKTYDARDSIDVAKWQIKTFGLPLCFGHQQGVKQGIVAPIRYERPVEDDPGEPPERPDDDSDLPF